MIDDDFTLFSERLKSIRESLGMNRMELSRSLGISKSSYCNFEAGETKPSFNFFLQISKVHNVNLRYLLHGEGEMFHKPLAPVIKEMIDLFEIPAIRLQVMADFKKTKEIFKPLIDVNRPPGEEDAG